MAWSLVRQSAAQTNNGTNTLPAASTAGNLLIATVSAGFSTAITAPTGWVTGPHISNGTVSESYIFYYPNNPGGLSSFTFSGPAGNVQVDISEWTCTGVSGLTGPSDTGTQTGGGTTALTIATGGTAKAGDLVIVSSLEHLAAGAAITWTDPGGFTEFSALTVASQNNHLYAAYRASAAAAGVQSVTVTSSATAAAAGYTGAVATFTEPGVSASLTAAQETAAAPAPTAQVSVSLPAAQDSIAAPAPSARISASLTAAQETATAPAPSARLLAALPAAQVSAAAPAPSPRITLALAAAQQTITAPAASPRTALTLAVARDTTAAPAPGANLLLALAVAHAATAAPVPSLNLLLALACAQAAVTAQPVTPLIVLPALGQGGGGSASPDSPGGEVTEGLPGGTAEGPTPGGTVT